MPTHTWIISESFIQNIRTTINLFTFVPNSLENNNRIVDRITEKCVSNPKFKQTITLVA